MEFSSKSLLCLLVIFVVSVYTVESLKCYRCNSGEAYDGKACEVLPPVNDFVQECDQTIGDKNYTRCRKTVQTVNGDTRTIRSCATAGDSTGCIDRTGTSGVRVKYCECNSPACNGSSGVVASILLVFVLVVSNALAKAS